MKKELFHIPVLTLTLVLATNLHAQNQKIGFIDSDLILREMPEYSGIEQRLSLLSEGWNQEIRTMENELSEMIRDFEAREILFTDEIRDQRMIEIQQKQHSIEQLIAEKFGPAGDYFTLQQDLLEPIQRELFDAVQRIAQRDNYDFVFDRSQDSRFLHVNQRWNLTREVMLELGLGDTGN
ncbi:MAG: OmpH family outer membrane protein [Balneolaceae bacterium]|nr:MAG: OmpH family outer membrane protein [Balneolaceae bacterium]